MLVSVEQDDAGRAVGHPMWRTIQFTLDDVQATYAPEQPEIWLNPEDWRELGGEVLAGWRIFGCPVRRSIGIRRGTARIFCRRSLRYLPPLG